MATYILIHGSWHGAWCWYKIVSRLAAAGQQALAPDLPSHGRDRTPPREVTLESYVDRVIELVDAQAEPVILVAHSRGGIVASQVAEARPAQVKRLVYLAAFLVPDGQTVFGLARQDPDSLVGRNLDVHPSEGWDMLRSAAFRETLYADCSDEDLALGRLLLTPEPIAASSTPLRLTEQNFGRVPRTYIELLQDRAVSPALQKRMYTALPCQAVLSLNASHSAYFSAPDELTGLLLALR